MKNKEPYRVENIVRKGEIACYKQFLLFSQCLPQIYIRVRQSEALYGNGLTFYHIANYGSSNSAANKDMMSKM